MAWHSLFMFLTPRHARHLIKLQAAATTTETGSYTHPTKPSSLLPWPKININVSYDQLSPRLAQNAPLFTEKYPQIIRTASGNFAVGEGSRAPHRGKAMSQRKRQLGCKLCLSEVSLQTERPIAWMTPPASVLMPTWTTSLGFLTDWCTENGAYAKDFITWKLVSSPL